MSYVGNINNNNIDYKLGGDNFNGGLTWFTTNQSWGIDTDRANVFVKEASIAVGANVTYSVADIIPNDGYDYEICLTTDAYAQTNTLSRQLNLWLTSGSSIPTSAIYSIVTRRLVTSGSKFMSSTTIWVPISANDKNITIYSNSTLATTYTLSCNGYRRIGKNGINNTNLLANINSYKIGGYNFDGQYVLNRLDIANGVAQGQDEAISYSLANYLPNDNKDYLVILSGFGQSITVANAGNPTWRIATGIKNFSDTAMYGAGLMATDHHSSQYFYTGGNLIIPVFANDRNITVAIDDIWVETPSPTYTLLAVGYRRLGTNE